MRSTHGARCPNPKAPTTVDVQKFVATKHLHALADAGIVRATERGRRRRVWELEPRRLQQAQRYLDRISHLWDDALERLKAFVEE